jgi:hypothetical protein
MVYDSYFEKSSEVSLARKHGNLREEYRICVFFFLSLIQHRYISIRIIVGLKG